MRFVFVAGGNCRTQENRIIFMMKVYNKRQIKNSIKFCNLCILILGLFYSTALHSQCATPIAVTPGTPYIENFETNPAWTTGGTEDDWAWGTPTKATINGAGSGSKCWVVGGLANNPGDGKPYYNHNERSWVQSPCLDFTALQYPFIAFLYFRESEWKYDGTNLQYSIDQGTTWVVIGTAAEATDCMDANWYNRTPVTYLTTPLSNIQDGWCGNVQAEYTDSGQRQWWLDTGQTLPEHAGRKA